MMHVADMIVEELETQDSEDDVAADGPFYRHYTLVLKTQKQGSQTYLLVDSKQEKVNTGKS